MSIGTGIFLGSLCLAFVILYGHTKDRWQWRVFGRWSLRIAVAGGAAFMLLLGYLLLRDYMDSKPKPAKEYAGISLGDSMDEVHYSKGTPAHVLDPQDAEGKDPWRTITFTKDIPAGKSVRDFLDWGYEPEAEARVSVAFSSPSKVVTRVFCYSAPGRVCPSLLGISPGMSEEAVIRTIGKPGSVELGGELGPAKKLKYPQFHVSYLLTRREVYGLEMLSEETTKQSRP
jgi:hypothetical protein